MKKIFLTIFAFALLILSACSGTAKDPNTLKISILLGGYGQLWAHTLARGFEDENPGITVEIEAFKELPAEIPSRLLNKSDDDIFFSHSVQWEMHALEGYLEDLSDLFDTEVEDGVLFKDRILPDYLDLTTFRDKPWRVPWTIGAGGLVYNAKMFREHGWEVPETYEELVTLVETIENANIPVDPNNTKPNAPRIKAFVWSAEHYYWDYLVMDWWAQLAGIDKINNFRKLESAEVYNPATSPEHMQAFSYWVDLVAKNPGQSMDGSSGREYIAAQMDFLNGYAAMIPNAQWLEMEMIDNLDPNIMEMALMPAPFVPGAKTDANGNPLRVNYSVGASNGDSIIIPKHSTNKELAKKFLLYIARNDSLKTFTEKTQGVMLGFDYSGVEFDEEKLSTFAKSVIEINTNSTKFTFYTQSLLVLDGKMKIEWGPTGITQYDVFYNYYNTFEYFNNPNTFPVKPILPIFEDAYLEIKNNWQKWMDEIN